MLRFFKRLILKEKESRASDKRNANSNIQVSRSNVGAGEIEY